MPPPAMLPSVSGVDSELGHRTNRDYAKCASFSWRFWRPVTLTFKLTIGTPFTPALENAHNKFVFFFYAFFFVFESMRVRHGGTRTDKTRHAAYIWQPNNNHALRAGFSMHSWSSINSEHQVNRRSVDRRSKLIWLVIEKPALRDSATFSQNNVEKNSWMYIDIPKMCTLMYYFLSQDRSNFMKFVP